MSLSNFDDVSFPLPLAFGASGGPERRTEIVSLSSGREVRNAVWAGSRRRWDVGGAVSSRDDLHALIAFFEARRGPLRGFRFRDYADDRSCPPEYDVSPADQVLGAADGAAVRFELIKTYGDAARRILKPVAGSVRVALDGVEVVSGFSVDEANGWVDFAAPPAPGVVVSAGYAFDCAARFNSDYLETRLEAFSAGRVVSVPIIELTG